MVAYVGVGGSSSDLESRRRLRRECVAVEEVRDDDELLVQVA